MVGAGQIYRKPVALGAGVGFAASVATWFLAAWVLGQLGGGGLAVQAATGLLAVIVLLVVMNWFFHKIYWTGWISARNRQRKRVLDRAGIDSKRATLIGLILLGVTSVYREGFEVVLFLQNLRLTYGASDVLEGVGLGLALTAAVGGLTFLAQRKLHYKRMLVVTGVPARRRPDRHGRRVDPGDAAGRLAAGNDGAAVDPWLGRPLVRGPSRRSRDSSPRCWRPGSSSAPTSAPSTCGCGGRASAAKRRRCGRARRRPSSRSPAR